MVRHLLIGAALVALTGAVVAQTDPIATRKGLMKGNGASARLGGQMAKGEVPFDPIKVQEIYSNFEKAAGVFPNLYPDNTKTGGDTSASPKVWEDMPDFRARFETWSKEIQQAAANSKDLDSFRTSFGGVTKACGSCHNVYRLKT